MVAGDYHTTKLKSPLIFDSPFLYSRPGSSSRLEHFRSVQQSHRVIGCQARQAPNTELRCEEAALRTEE